MPKTETFNREEMLEKVAHLFHSKGYNATSMQDLVDATGLNRSSIYNSFGSKLELYQEGLKVYRNQASRQIQKALINSDNPLEAIRKVFTLNANLRSTQKNNGCLINNCTMEMANHDTAIKNFLVNNRDEMLSIFEELIAKGQNDGCFNTNKSAKEYAMYLFTALQGLRITGMIVNDTDDLNSIIETTLSLII